MPGAIPRLWYFVRRTKRDDPGFLCFSNGVSCRLLVILTLRPLVSIEAMSLTERKRKRTSTFSDLTSTDQDSWRPAAKRTTSNILPLQDADPQLLSYESNHVATASNRRAETASSPHSGEATAFVSNDQVPTNLALLLDGTPNHGSEGVEIALLGTFVICWAVLFEIGRMGDAIEIVVIGREMFGEELDKALSAFISTASVKEVTKDELMSENGVEIGSGESREDMAVAKLARLFWLLVGVRRMEQAQAVRVIGKHLHREGMLSFEQIVMMLGRELRP
ncbi:hypothetical protein Slin15195_G114990 [Septoria linicola]|uniref:Uncharacterized protein n=1 Tax=Septoria linicola TaxID=215465 RepID=A0A9Q9B4N9_9PEZI|nr:hypothetical protein Slin14017_G122960 [Septoria linicola]USW58180.1 hypothetical protein Slin15195_G114990 [Septoria linicola]